MTSENIGINNYQRLLTRKNSHIERVKLTIYVERSIMLYFASFVLGDAAVLSAIFDDDVRNICVAHHVTTTVDVLTKENTATINSV